MSEISRENVVAAAERIAGSIERTPLIASEVAGESVWLKCECLQTGGAFKLRGATNRLLQLSAAERARGVVAFSSGNHARGVALAARRLGIRAIIVMPADAPAVKVEGTRAEGAEIVFYDRRTESREAIAARLADESGGTVVPSFDVVSVSDAEVEAAVRFAFEQHQLVVEPGGAAALAAVLAGTVAAEPDMVIVLSGGNVDPALHARMVA